MSTPFMNLTLPIPGNSPGPAWAQTLNTAIGVGIDSHRHITGEGQQVPTAGINIDADFSFNSFNAKDIRALRLNDQTGPLSGSDIRSLYSVNGDLYYNNSALNPIQITNGSFLASNNNINLIEQNVNGNLTILSSDPFYYLRVNTSAARTLTLPLANTVSAGRYYIFKDLNGLSASNNISIQPAGADTTDGTGSAAIRTLATNFGSWTFVSDGVSNWDIFFSNNESSMHFPFPKAVFDISKKITLNGLPGASAYGNQIPTDWSWTLNGWVNNTQNQQVFFQIDNLVDLATIKSIDFNVKGNSFSALPTGSNRALYAFYVQDGYGNLATSAQSIFDPSASVGAFNAQHVVHLDLTSIASSCFVAQTPNNINNPLADWRTYFVSITSPNNNYVAGMAVMGVQVNYTTTQNTPG